jgi:PAS domain S-box-containing protein
MQANWQYTPLFFPLIVGALISIVLAVFSWRHRSARGAAPFAVLMLCVAWWSIGYAIQLGHTDLDAKVFQSNLNFVAIFVIPIPWLAFTLQYTGQDRSLTRRNLILLGIVPLVMMIVVWTDNLHHWFRTRVIMILVADRFLVMEPTHGVAFWVFVAYAYPLILLGAGLLLRYLLRSPGVIRAQAIAIVIGTLAPLSANALSIFDLIPIQGIDLTPFAFVITGVTMGWALFRFQLLDVVPIARDRIIEGMRDGVIVLDSRKRIVDLNHAAQELLDLSAAQVIGHASRDVLASWPELAEYAHDIVEAHAEITLNQGAAQRFFDLRISPLQDIGGRSAGRLIVLRDISARKRAEGELTAILESIADGVIVFDPVGRAIVANPAITNLLGIHADEVIGLHIEELLIDAVAAEERAVLATALGSNAMFCPSIQIKWGTKTLSASAAPVRLESGDVIGSVAVFRDFTHEAEVDRMKSTFVSIASHELRAPLTAIMGYSEMLREGVFGSLAEEQMDVVKRLLANTNQMMSLANNLLDQARMEAGEISLSPTDFSPADLAHSVCEMMEITAHSKGVQLTCDIADDAPQTVTGDMQRLRQILINLTSNAIKFTDEGRVTLHVYAPDANYWALAVSDTGCGISKEGQEIVFEPFRREESVARKYGGAGLGLSIAKQLVELMGGEILLESQVGEGSTFTVVLPLNVDR